MKKFLLVILLGCLHAHAAAACTQPEGGMAWEACMHDEAMRMQEPLLDAALARQRGNARVNRLLDAAQTQWQRYRERNCSLEQAAWGELADISFARCMHRMLDERIDDLQHAHATQRLAPLPVLAAQVDAANAALTKGWLDDPEWLTQAHAAWLDFHSTSCAYERARYGKGHPPDQCERRMTTARLAYLKRYD